jgi:capsule polysaccharide export protein KpsE/RkpR
VNLSGDTTTVLTGEREERPAAGPDLSIAPSWVVNTAILWQRRHLLSRVIAASLLLSLLIAFTLPKRYKSSARIMPPSNSSMSTAMLAALAGRSFGAMGGGLGALAGLFGMSGSSALYVDLLRSGAIADDLITRFDLQRAYHKRYRIDTAKYLAHHTDITDDKKSGIITIAVDDTDPRRARDIAQGYLDGLNRLVIRTSTSSAHRERLFVEKRLEKVQADLETAQQQMSEFASTHATIDIKEQTRAIVEAAAKVQGQLIVEQSSLTSLRQIYGDDNIRVRAAEARIRVLQGQLSRMSGSSAPLPTGQAGDAPLSTSEMSPPLRQLPRLAVPYADLYRQVQVQETVFELLTQQCELARIQEAKDTPVISVIDAPGIPEKKSFPPRLVVAMVLTCIATGLCCALLLAHYRWTLLNADDPRKQLIQAIIDTLRTRLQAHLWSGGVR